MACVTLLNIPELALDIPIGESVLVLTEEELAYFTSQLAEGDTSILNAADNLFMAEIEITLVGDTIVAQNDSEFAFTADESCVTASPDACDELSDDVCIPTTDTPEFLDITTIGSCYTINFIPDDSDSVECDELELITPTTNTLIRSEGCTAFSATELCELILGCLSGDDLSGDDGQAGADGADGQDGLDGVDGNPGASAYDVWLSNGNAGTVTDFLISLMGDSAYDIYLESGGTGTISDFIASLAGTSAYDSWLAQGNTGTEGDFILSLEGDSAYEAWLADGNTGTVTDFLNSLNTSISDGDCITVSPAGQIIHDDANPLLPVINSFFGVDFDAKGHAIGFDPSIVIVTRRFSGNIDQGDTDLATNLSTTFNAGSLDILFDVASTGTAYQVVVVDENGQPISDVIISNRATTGFTITTAFTGDIFVSITE